MTFKQTLSGICPLCAGISSLWLLLSAGIAWDFFAPSVFLLPIALLMGGTVVGIAYLGEKRCRWAAQRPLKWKGLAVGIGMPLAYLLITHLAKITVIGEFILLLIIAYFFFIKQSRIGTPDELEKNSQKIRDIEKEMEQCC